MTDKHIKTQKGISCPIAGELPITEWQGIGWVYDAPLYQQIIHDVCPECKEPIKALLPSRGPSTDENLALDLLSAEDPENGC